MWPAEAASPEMPSHAMTTEDDSDPHKALGQQVRCELPQYLLEKRESYQALLAECPRLEAEYGILLA